ncbi:MAG TPA: hypothetical protein VFQ85_08505 [Mycobacteriales bacterium]|jgi:hypothetical protein|nr:hypothetical protein [Mycobacteriales bacterium]
MRTLVVVAALALTACSGGGGTAAPTTAAGTTAAATTAATTAPAPEASATFTAGAVLFSDDFTTKTHGWPNGTTANATYTVHTEYAHPQYTVTVRKAGTQLFPHPDFRGVSEQQLASYRVAADLQSTLAFGQGDWLGVTCRDLNDKRYSFQLTNDLATHTASWRIAKHDGARLTPLASGDTTIGGSAWAVAGTCATTASGVVHLVMTVNDQEVGRVTDTDAPLLQGFGGVYLLSGRGRATINVLSFSVTAVTAVTAA